MMLVQRCARLVSSERVCGTSNAVSVLCVGLDISSLPSNSDAAFRVTAVLSPRVESCERSVKIKNQLCNVAFALRQA